MNQFRVKIRHQPNNPDHETTHWKGCEKVIAAASNSSSCPHKGCQSAWAGQWVVINHSNRFSPAFPLAASSFACYLLLLRQSGAEAPVAKRLIVG